MVTTVTSEAGLAEKAAELLKGLDKTHFGAGNPHLVVSDIDPESTSTAKLTSHQVTGAKRHDIQTGQSIQNPFVESFGGHLRGGRLTETAFRSLGRARASITEWQDGYNSCRPHASLDELTSADFARRRNQGQHNDGTSL